MRRSPNPTPAPELHVDPSRGSIVLENLLGKDDAGMISCDFWGAYRRPLRQSIAETDSRDVLDDSWSGSLDGCDLVAENAGSSGRDVESGVGHDPGKQGCDHHCGTVVAVLLKYGREEYFRFIDTGIPAPNNLGEQTLRKVVIDRKVTQGTRSDWGNRWLERFWSVLPTCEQQSTNVMSFLQSCVESFLHGLAPPSLLRD